MTERGVLSVSADNAHVNVELHGRYSSDSGSSEINLTSTNKKSHVNQKHFQYTNINEFQGKSFILLFTGHLQIFFLQLI